MWISELILFLKANMLAESKPEVRPDRIYITHILPVIEWLANTVIV